MTHHRDHAYFKSLTQELYLRAARATLGLLSPNSDALRRHLTALFEQPPGSPTSFLADPVFEATFGWPLAPETMQQLAASGLLHEGLVAAMDSDSSESRFPATRAPFQHQLAAWRTLQVEPPQSIVVTSGTGSGKTECFLVPILNDLVRHADASGPLTGVRALFLYPLNALINSQRDRLRGWTQALGNRVRFCLYNGTTPGSVPADQQRRFPQEVLARDTLRADPPPILVTNATMLEYMLVRQDDRPILDQSRGQLRWIVLDEAHTYIGSDAAEIALLLRRVLHAFGVSSTDVRFIATSATIGSADDVAVEQQLRGFLANVAGVPPERVTVIKGKRERPDLPAADPRAPLPEIEELATQGGEDRHDALVRSSRLHALRVRLSETAATLTDISTLLFDRADDDSRVRSLHFLDLARHAHRDGVPLLPLRGHIFQRAQSGLWACCSRTCLGRNDLALNDPSWPFGMTYIERQDKCRHCGSQVFEVVLCTRCGAEYLSARRITDASRVSYTPSPVLRASDGEESLDDKLDKVDDDDERQPRVELSHRRLLGRYTAPETDDHPATRLIRFDEQTGEHGGDGTATLDEVAPRKNNNLYCANCGTGEQNPGDLLRPIRTSGAFHLGVAIPTLLEFSPAGPTPRSRPFAGRRTITFSDSRQGTARFALKTQIDSERNFIRSYLYHLVSSLRKTVDTAKVEQELAELEPALATAKGIIRETLARTVADLRASLAGAPGEIAWSKAVSQLALSPTFLHWLAPQWRDRIGDPSRLANFMLLREFARRPTRQNSLETLGLVRVDYIGLRDPRCQAPPDSRRFALTLEDWRDLLKLLLDFVVRANSAVLLDPPEALRWMGTTFHPRSLLGPDTPASDGERLYRWPAVRTLGRSSRMISLIAAVLRLDLTDPDDLRAIQGLLVAAWDQLHALQLLQRREAGSQLDPENSAILTTIDRAWFCPVTRRVLDTTFRGFSPFPLGQQFQAAIPLTMPRLRHVFPEVGDARGAPVADAIDTWLAEDADVCAARARGIWSDLSDRLVAFSSYFRIGEHSAQQGPARLDELERDFKEGKLNLLSCSTTMEMGVDIGGLSTVAMNNAPPSPANFLQRAGRAGRRGETAAVSLTMCKSDPHGEAVFRNPLWPFTTPIHVPSVSLQSERIVQRHVNALVLTHFLLAHTSDALHLTMAGFFEPPSATASSFADQFHTWLASPPSPALDGGIQQLTHGSCLGGLATRQLLLRTTDALEVVREPWTQELTALKASLDEFGGPPPAKGNATAAQLAIHRQLERLRGEYLLGELATRGFLPGHGFPTGLVPFIHTTLEQLRRERAARERRRATADAGTAGEREDSPFRRGGFPTRGLPIAIREYAPGSTLVIDGEVHQSAGVTLNWHLPPGDLPSSELQAFRRAWLCKACGAAGTSAILKTNCEVCANPQIRQIEYLQPAGFAVQIAARPTNIIDNATYIPTRDPWISAGHGVWNDLPRPELGRVRVTEHGQLIYRSGGMNGQGYAICLYCGYAVSMDRPDGRPPKIPDAMSGHRHLRGGKAEKGDARCPGSDTPHKIKTSCFLGAALATDVLELQFHGLVGQTTSGDEVVATTLAAALRQALADKLGIDERELGWAQISARDRRDQKTRSIILYDTADGGAGYVAAVPRLLPELLRTAQQILDCPAKCDRACHACLLTFDTQHKMEHLDRKRGLEALSDAVLDALDLPPEMHVFAGSLNQYELEPFTVAIGREIQRTGVSEIRIYLGGDAGEWELNAWPLRDQIVRWSLSGIHVVLCVDPATFDDLEDIERSLLAALAELAHVSIHTVAPPSPGANTRLLAVAAGAQRHTRWASFGATLAPPGPDWLASLRLVASTTQGSAAPMTSTVAKPARIRRPPPHSMREIKITHEFDQKPISQFGKLFWGLIGRYSPGLAARLAQGRPLAKIEYADRYLRSPLTVRLFHEWIIGLAAYPGVISSETRVHVITEDCSPDGVGRYFDHDWQTSDRRQAVVDLLFGKTLAFAFTVKKRSSHARELTLTWDEDHSFLLRPDEGLGFLGAHMRFDFTRRPEQQAQTILEARPLLSRRHENLPSYLYIRDI
jgi:DEAD/DEAH box helicase domain-containing protein